MTEQLQSEEMPPMAYFAGTATLLAVTLADDRPTERLEKAIHKMISIAESATGLSETLLKHTLATIKEHGIQFYMPGDEPQLEDVLHQVHRAQQELKNSAESGVIAEEEYKSFTESVRQIALAAIFIDAESEPTQEQNEVLNYLYRITTGED